MVTLDKMNLRILDELQNDARLHYTTIARRLNRSESTVRDRIEAMERQGPIRGYTCVLDHEALGLPVKALVRATVPYGDLEHVARQVAACPWVQDAHLLTGDRNLAFTLLAPDIRSMESTIAGEVSRRDVTRVETHVVTETLAQSKALPLTKLLG